MELELPTPPGEIDMAAFREAALYYRDGCFAIGKFMCEFSQLEFTIRHVLHERLRLEEKLFDIVIGPYDFKMLCAVTQKVSCLKYPDRKEAITKLFKEIYALNDKRVHLAHATLTDAPEGFSLRVFNRQKLDSSFVDYTIEDLRSFGDKAQSLMQRVMGFQGKS